MEVFEPGITTVAQPMPELGRVAVDMLLARLAGEAGASRVLPHRLVLRASAPGLLSTSVQIEVIA